MTFFDAFVSWAMSFIEWSLPVLAVITFVSIAVWYIDALAGDQFRAFLRHHFPRKDDAA